MIEEQRKDCKYISQKCPNYSPDSYTCNHGGGDYCGKWRWYENRTTLRKILAKIEKYMCRFIVPVYCIGGMFLMTHCISIDKAILLLMTDVIVFGIVLALFIMSIPRWIR